MKTTLVLIGATLLLAAAGCRTRPYGGSEGAVEGETPIVSEVNGSTIDLPEATPRTAAGANLKRHYWSNGHWEEYHYNMTPQSPDY